MPEKETSTVFSEISVPIANKKDHILKIHNHERNDPYYWLRDDERKDPEMLAYLTAENDYTKAKMAHTEELQQTLFKEMSDRLEPTDESVPVFEKGYWHWSKFAEGKDYLIHFRQKGDTSTRFENQADCNKPEILFDQNLRAEGKEFYSLGDLSISPNQKLLAFSEDVISRRQYTIRVKDLDSGEFFSEEIENTSGEIIWANDNKTFFYVKKHPETLLPFQVYAHRLDSDVKNDILIYEEFDNTFYTEIYQTRSEKFIGIYISSIMSSEVHFIDADKPESPFKTFLKRQDEHYFEVDHINGYFYVQTDLDAPNEKIIRVAEDKIGTTDHWQEIVSHDQNTLLQGFELFDQYMAINERCYGLEKLRLRDYQGKLIQEIKFNDAAYSTGFSQNPDPKSKVIRYFYSSLTTPPSEFEYDVDSKKSVLLKQDKVLGDFSSENYQSERILVKANDNQLIPVSIVYAKDKFKKDGNNPLLQYAYGSYGITIDAGFSIARLSLLDRGFVFAIAHIRGGKMLGRHWYEEGKKLNKLNSFNDYISVSKELILQGYCAKDKLYGMGGSAGGLLMAGIINMAPTLYHGVVAAVPFVDIVTTMLDESIPLTTGEYDEWGNPNDKIFYDYMLSYSPYDQVKAQAYPNLLVVTGFYDSQVQYWEPAKWVAKLRDKKTDHNLLLLYTDMEAGHGGKSGRYTRFADTARQYAFILDLAGIQI